MQTMPSGSVYLNFEKAYVSPLGSPYGTRKCEMRRCRSKRVNVNVISMQQRPAFHMQSLDTYLVAFTMTKKVQKM